MVFFLKARRRLNRRFRRRFETLIKKVVMRVKVVYLSIKARFIMFSIDVCVIINTV